MGGLYYTNNYLFNGKVVNKKSVDREFRKKVAILFQNPESMILNPTVYDEIAFSLREFDIEVGDKVEKIAKEFEITHLLNKNPLKLSGGEKQKVILASLLIYEPELLLLDEPTTAMDPKTTGWFIDFLNELKITTIIATHDLALAYEATDRAIVLNEEHRILFDGDIETLFKDKELLLSANLIYNHKKRKREFRSSEYHLHI